MINGEIIDMQYEEIINKAPDCKNIYFVCNKIAEIPDSEKKEKMYYVKKSIADLKLVRRYKNGTNQVDIDK